MDDFLHNLRSGKLKQPDRSSRPYGDPNYKNPQRRNMLDRRKRDFGNKESSEKLDAIKETLENLSESQRRLVEAYEARTAVEERKARAMEVLAKNLYRMLNPNAADADSLFNSNQTAAPRPAEPVDYPAETIDRQEADADVQSENADAGDVAADALENSGDEENSFGQSEASSDKLSEDGRQILMNLISKMRQEGNNWERIARVVAEKGYPTISGRGSWRGVMVKNLYEKMETE